MSGDRSSWLTSEVKRASRSMRSWSWSTIRLKAEARTARSAKSALSRRVSRRPPAMASAAWAVSCSGRKARLAAQRPDDRPAERRDEGRQR